METTSHRPLAVPSRTRAILKQRCPNCRVGAVFSGMARMNRTCPVCGLKFEREAGYFVGAMYFSYALAVIFIGLFTFIAGLLAPGLSVGWLSLIGGVAFIPLIIPIFRFSRVMWLHFDRAIDPEPTANIGPPSDIRNGNGRIKE